MSFVKSLFAAVQQCLPGPLIIIRIDFKADESCLQPVAGQAGITQTHEGIENFHALYDAVQFDTVDGELRGKRSRMRPVFGTILNGPVGNKPTVAATADIRPGAFPATYIGGILIRHADGSTIQLDIAFFGKMENILMGVVKKSATVDRLIMADIDVFLAAVRVLVDINRLHPVDDILEYKEIVPLHGFENLERHQRIGWFRTDIQKQRAVVFQDSFDIFTPFVQPGEIIRSGDLIVIRFIFYAQIVRRRGDDHIDRSRPQPFFHTGNTIFVE